MNTSKKILSISHYDMDGQGCAIVLANVFKNIKFITATFTNIDGIIKNTDFSEYDLVFMTDVYPKDIELLDDIPNLILLDHHETNKSHEPSNNRYVITDICGAMITKNYIESKLNVDLSHLNSLIYLINDYDMWIHNNKKSKMLNELYYWYRGDKFRERFMSGNTRLLPNEIDYIKKQKKKFLETYNELEVFDFDKINGCFFIFDFNFVNDLCEKLLKEEKYDVVFCQNPRTGNISVRTNIRPDINLGETFTELELGGGHCSSAGLRGIDNSFDSLKSVLKVVEYELLKKYPQIKR